MSVKVLVFLLTCVSLSGQTLIQTITATSGSTAVTSLTLNITATTGNAIFFGVTGTGTGSNPSPANTVTTCSDGTNTYTADRNTDYGGTFSSNGGILKQYRAFSITGGSLSIVCSFTLVSGFSTCPGTNVPCPLAASMVAFEFSGISGPTDVPGYTGATAYGSNLMQANHNPFALRPIYANDLVVGFLTTNTPSETLSCSPSCGDPQLGYLPHTFYYGLNSISSSSITSTAVLFGIYCFDTEPYQYWEPYVAGYISPWTYGSSSSFYTGSFQTYQCSGCTSGTTPACTSFSSGVSGIARPNIF